MRVDFVFSVWTCICLAQTLKQPGWTGSSTFIAHSPMAFLIRQMRINVPLPCCRQQPLFDSISPDMYDFCFSNVWCVLTQFCYLIRFYSSVDELNSHSALSRHKTCNENLHLKTSFCYLHFIIYIQHFLFNDKWHWTAHLLYRAGTQRTKTRRSIKHADWLCELIHYVCGTFKCNYYYYHV